MMAIMAKRRIQKVRQTRRCEPLFFRTVLACQDSGLEGRSVSLVRKLGGRYVRREGSCGRKCEREGGGEEGGQGQVRGRREAGKAYFRGTCAASSSKCTAVLKRFQKYGSCGTAMFVMFDSVDLFAPSA